MHDSKLIAIPASAVRHDQPRWWCYSRAEADALLRGAGSLITAKDLHLGRGQRGVRLAIVVDESKD